MKQLTALVCLLFASVASAQSVTLPPTVSGDPGAIYVKPLAYDADSIAWISLDRGASVTPIEFLSRWDICQVIAVKEGSYRIMALPVKTIGGKAIFGPTSTCTVIVGNGPLPPIPPIPPIPPKPDPKPDPSPAPIPLAGFRVLFVYESSVASNTLAIVSAKPIQDYLAAKCVKDGQKSEWAVWDKDVKLDNVKQHWKDAMARPRTTLPWIIISDGRQGYEGPLPKTVDETLTLLKKIGG